MAVDRNRLETLRGKGFMRYDNRYDNALQRGQGSFETRRKDAKWAEDTAKGRFGDDRFMRNSFLADARQIRKDASTRGNDYKYGTKAEVQAQHNSRYRNIRKAFGMTAG